MQLLNFDEVNKYTEFVTWVTAMEPSEVMENKTEIRDRVFDLLEYVYMLGFVTAREELGVIAEWATPFLPDDYIDNRLPSLTNEPTDSSAVFSFLPQGTATGSTEQRTSDNPSEGGIPEDFEEREREAIYRRYNGLDFSDRVIGYAELGDVPSIIRVAETDGHRVYNDGGFLGAEGIAKTKTWNTMMDDRVRDLHQYLDGVTIAIDDEFYTYDDDHGRYPGDFESASNNANCRCWLTFNR